MPAASAFARLHRLIGGDRPSPSGHWSALLLIAGAVAGCLAMDAWLPDRIPFAVLILPVLIAAALGSAIGGLATTALGLLVGAVELSPGGILASDGPSAARLLLFAASGVGISLLGYRLHRMRERERRAVAAQASADRARADERALFQAVIDGIPDPIFVKDHELRYVVANRSVAEVFSVAPAAVVGRKDSDFLPLPTATALNEVDREVIRTGRPQESETRMPLADGERIMRATKTPWRAGNGRPLGLIGISRDVTAERRVADDLHASAARYRAIVETAVDAVIVIDEEGIVQSFNPAAEAIFGYLPGEIVGRNVSLLMPHTMAGAHDGYLAAYRATGQRRIIGTGRTVDGRRKDGSSVPLDLAVAEWETGGQRFFTGILRDITERRRFEQRLAHQALHDALTGLPNRALVLDRLQQALALAERHESKVAVILLDLDGFKRVNDELGHPAGDQLLVSFAERLTATIRSSDTVGRLGGDEFTIIQPLGEQPAGALALARRVVAQLEAPVRLDGREVPIATSIGIALFPDDGREAHDLLRAADVALYLAKRSGRGQFRFYEPEMDFNARGSRRTERELERAIHARQFVLHYQPQIDLRSNRIIGVEALVRWRHPERGLVGPDEFIGIAERTGLIRPLGAWIIREACRQASTWQDQGLALNVAVNLSPVQLRDPDLVDTIDRALAACGLDAALLQFELTETALMDMTQRLTRHFLNSMAARGIRLAIDDFGEACSVIAYLREPSLRRIKISRTFTASLPNDGEGRKLVKAMIALAHSLDCEVVAEAVENEAQLAFLRSQGCHQVQGFLFSRPVPAEEVQARFAPAAGRRLA